MIPGDPDDSRDRVKGYADHGLGQGSGQMLAPKNGELPGFPAKDEAEAQVRQRLGKLINRSLEIGALRVRSSGPVVRIKEIPLVNIDPVSEAIQSKGHPWMGIGLDRRVRDRDVFRSGDLTSWLIHLGYFPEAGVPPAILVADSGLADNAFAESWKQAQKISSDNRPSNEELRAEAGQVGRLNGLREKAYIEAIQETVFGEGGEPRCNPVHLMSDTIDTNLAFQRILAKIKELIETDETIAEKMWALVPSVIKKTAGTNAEHSTFAELKDSLGSRKRTKALHIMAYPARESAVTIWLSLGEKGGTKIGNPGKEKEDGNDQEIGERPYDELTEYIVRTHGAELGINPDQQLKFKYPAIERTEKSVPYGLVRIRSLEDEPVNVMGLCQGSRSWENISQGRENLQVNWDIYKRFLEKIDALPLEPEAKEALQRKEAFQIMIEIVLQFNFVPAIRYLFLKTGVLRFIEEYIKSGDAESAVSHLLQERQEVPFTCTRGDKERAEAFFLRYVFYLLSGSTGPSMAVSQSLEEQEIHKMLSDVSLQLYKRLSRQEEMDADHDDVLRAQYRTIITELREQGEMTAQEVREAIGRNEPRLPLHWKKTYLEWCKALFHQTPWEVDWDELNAQLLSPQSSPHS